MIIHPAVIVHGLADAKAALSFGAPVTLLSAPGAAAFAGCLWWREVVESARADFPGTEAMDILDCADASGLALGALRNGVMQLVLWPEAPGWARVAAVAGRQGGLLLPGAPAALDLARRGAARRLCAWLDRAGSADDKSGYLK
ncbi:MAG TPA: hypothetical protein VGM32_05575 [Rhodopila sp.]|jgi:hypothetical protein